MLDDVARLRESATTVQALVFHYITRFFIAIFVLAKIVDNVADENCQLSSSAAASVFDVTFLPAKDLLLEILAVSVGPVAGQYRG